MAGMREISEHDWDRDPNAVTDYSGLVEYTTQWRGDDLVPFLRARLDEDEAVANAAAQEKEPGWRADQNWLMYEDPEDGAQSVAVDEIDWEGAAITHAARHDPARVLREIYAKRAILAGLEATHHRYIADDPYYSCPQAIDPEDPDQEPGSGWNSGNAVPGQENECWCGRDEAVAHGLKILAAVYSDHPDYRQEWKPAG